MWFFVHVMKRFYVYSRNNVEVGIVTVGTEVLDSFLTNPRMTTWISKYLARQGAEPTSVVAKLTTD